MSEQEAELWHGERAAVVPQVVLRVQRLEPRQRHRGDALCVLAHVVTELLSGLEVMVRGGGCHVLFGVRAPLGELLGDWNHGNVVPNIEVASFEKATSAADLQFNVVFVTAVGAQVLLPVGEVLFEALGRSDTCRVHDAPRPEFLADRGERVLDEAVKFNRDVGAAGSIARQPFDSSARVFAALLVGEQGQGSPGARVVVEPCV
ncbi:MAG TPA: hypothetical protein VF624_15235 [Tepidisphaeraceae bacterium]